MARLSVGKAWEEAVAFVRREAQLMLPVALLFLAVPVAIVGQMVPADFVTTMNSANGRLPPLPGSVWLAMLIMILMLQIGSLALLALALKPGISVAESIHRAMRRLPVAVAALLLLVAAMLVVTMLASLVGGVLALAGGAALGVSATFFIILPIIFFGGVRLALLHAVIADRDLGPVASLRAGWALTAGHFWRLFAFLILTALVAQLISLAFASIFGIIGGLLGGQSVAALLSGLVSAMVVAAAQVYILTMLARLYRQAES